MSKKSKTITLADLARELNIGPKIARAKCRRNREHLTRLVGKSLSDGWEFSDKCRSKLIEFLTNGVVPHTAVSAPVEIERQNYRRLVKKDRH
jgi:hypothetical protein